MLESNVVELRYNRRGFLNTRIAKWNQVNVNRTKFGSKAASLEVNIAEKKVMKGKLDHDLK